jgi:hypothetical protein
MLHSIVLVGLILFNLLPPLNARPATSSGSRLDIAIEELAPVRFLGRVDVDEYKRSFAQSSHRLILLDNDVGRHSVMAILKEGRILSQGVTKEFLTRRVS